MGKSVQTDLHLWKIYLDTCCLSRIFDPPTQARIRREAEAINIYGYSRRFEMNILEMTEGELYKAGLEELIGQMGTTYTEQFLKLCKPNDHDYTTERHKSLDDDPDIPTVVNQIQERKIAQEAEERIRAKRIEAWRKGSLELTNIEICELGAKILTEKLGVPGSIVFLRHHFKQNEWAQSVDLPQQPVSDRDTDAILTQQKHATELQD